MKIISIFLGLTLNSIVKAQGPARRDTSFTHLAGRNIQDDGTHYYILAKRHLPISATSKLTARSRIYEDSSKLSARHAEANFMAGLKKMASSALKKHGPTIIKFAHGQLQEQLKKFIPAASKDKGKSKDKDKDKEKDKGKEKVKDKKEGKGEKSGKEKSSFGSRDLMGGIQAYGSDLWSRREDHFDTLMSIYDMAERGVAFIDPERSLWDYD